MLAAVSPDEALEDQTLPYRRLLSERRFDEVQARLTELAAQALQSHDGECAYYYAMAEDFGGLCLSQGPQMLALLWEWQRRTPQRGFALLHEAFYWQVWMSEFRTEYTVDMVAPENWECAHAAQTRLLLACLHALNADASLWPAMQVAMQAVAVLGQPEWLNELLSGKPVAVSPQRPALSAQAAVLWAQAEAPGGAESLGEVSLPPGVREAAAASPEIDARLFWLRRALSVHPALIEVRAHYAHYLIPRWGGDEGDVLRFVDSPDCASLNEDQKWLLRFTHYWDLAEVLDLPAFLSDLPRARRHLKFVESLLEHPFAPNMRGRLHKYIAYLTQKLDPQADTSEHYRQATDIYYQDWELGRAWNTWLSTDGQGDWIAKIAIMNRERLADAAVLYGYLCANGWAGVTQRPEVAEAWFEHASQLKPPGNYRDDCPFNRISEHFYDHEDFEHGQLLWDWAAARGYSRSQFVLGYLALKRGETDRALSLFEKASEREHIPSIINVGTIHWNKSLKGVDDDQACALQARALACFRRAHALETEFGEEYATGDALRIYLRAAVDYWDMQARAQELPHLESLLPELDEPRQLQTMLTIAQIKATKGDPFAFDYAGAMAWIERALRLDPNHEQALEIQARLVKESPWRSKWHSVFGSKER